MTKEHSHEIAGSHLMYILLLDVKAKALRFVDATKSIATQSSGSNK